MRRIILLSVLICAVLIAVVILRPANRVQHPNVMLRSDSPRVETVAIVNRRNESSNGGYINVFVKNRSASDSLQFSMRLDNALVFGGNLHFSNTEEVVKKFTLVDDTGKHHLTVSVIWRDSVIIASRSVRVVDSLDVDADFHEDPSDSVYPRIILSERRRTGVGI